MYIFCRKYLHKDKVKLFSNETLHAFKDAYLRLTDAKAVVDKHKEEEEVSRQREAERQKHNATADWLDKKNEAE
jgi:hypothetical protein